MPMDVIDPGPFGDGPAAVIIITVVVVALLGFALWRYFRTRRG